MGVVYEPRTSCSVGLSRRNFCGARWPSARRSSIASGLEARTPSSIHHENIGVSLGGTPQRILEDLMTRWRSHDGKQMAFAYFEAGQGEQPQLVVAMSDGGQRHVATERQGHVVNGSYLSWSADGKLIAAAQYELAKGSLSSLLIFTPQATSC
jgi:hypothetical protein